MSNIDTVVLGYRPNDFFYTLYDETYNTATDIPLNDCITTTRNSCTTTDTYSDSWKTCAKIELCKNKEYADTISKIQIKHSGADERNTNAETIYNNELIKITNLGIGIILLGIFIFYNK